MQGPSRSVGLTGSSDHRRAGNGLDRSRREERAGFVVELVGPPGAGKTTLARAVGAALERRGVAATLGLSARPAELERSGLPGAQVLARVGKLTSLFASPRNEPVAEALFRLMPLKGGLSYLRRRRYLAGLAARRADTLRIEDQGYVCAVAGLAVDSGRGDVATLARALATVPLPDLVVRLDVPEDIAQARLRQRLSQQGTAERMLERRPESNARLVAALDAIGSLLARSGRPALRVSSRDRIGLEAAVVAVVAEVLERRPVPCMEAVDP